MSSWMYPATLVALSYVRPATVSAADVDVSWHAPARTDINNLTKVMNGEGVYGFIYDTSDTPDDDYGAYNWCNMPHVRRTEYVKPSDEFDLQYVELIHRHHKRTPYAANSFPVESYHWDCNDQGLFYYGEPFQGHDPASAYLQGYISPMNPFISSGWIGTCQFPQITAEGLDDSWQHGADLYGVYHDLLDFLPGRDQDYSSKVQYRVTNNVITSQVAGMVINAMWDTTERFPLLIQATGVDSLEPRYSCSAGSSLLSAIQSSSNPEWQGHLDAASDLYAVLDDISGVPADDSGFHVSFDHYYDNLAERQCHDKPLPCKLVDGANSTTCVTQDLADTVYRLGHWEYSQIYRDNSSSLPASATTFGVWIGELTTRLRGVMEGQTGPIYVHNVAHDGSVSRLLSIMQLDEMVWPGMGAEVVFELYKKSGGGTAPTATVIAPGCSHNNCLRQFIRHPGSASSFCESFTPSATAALPTWPSECDDAGQMSSACSCLDTATPAPTSTGTGTVPSQTAVTSESGFYARVLFGGQVLKSSSPTLGLIDMIPVEALLGYFDGLVGEGADKVKPKCDGDTPIDS